jgi:hypothetical protein
MEQYCWVVAGKRVERFADVTALVLKRHHVAIDEKVPTEELPAYVRRALNIMAGKEPLHLINNPLPIGAHPAIASRITPVDLSEEPSL